MLRFLRTVFTTIMMIKFPKMLCTQICKFHMSPIQNVQIMSCVVHTPFRMAIFYYFNHKIFKYWDFLEQFSQPSRWLNCPKKLYTQILCTYPHAHFKRRSKATLFRVQSQLPVLATHCVIIVYMYIYVYWYIIYSIYIYITYTLCA